MWRIRSVTEKDNHGRSKYWSVDLGWTWKDFATLFTSEEKDSVILPKNAVWEEVEQ